MGQKMNHHLYSQSVPVPAPKNHPGQSILLTYTRITDFLPGYCLIFSQQGVRMLHILVPHMHACAPVPYGQGVADA